MPAPIKNPAFYPVHLAIDYLRYLWHSRQLHGTHSPFVYALVENVLMDEREYYAFREIEMPREKLLASKESVEVEDFGAGSKNFNGSKRSISRMVRTGSIKPRFGRLLFRLVNEFQPNTILELGTQMGLGTLYMAKGRANARIISLEGSEQVAEKARQHLSELKIENVEVRTGRFEDTLQGSLNDLEPVDFAYVDGDHTKASTLKHYKLLKEHASPCAIMVFDDIRWSADMFEAWQEICEDEAAVLTIDLFYVGLVFFGLKMEKQGHMLRY